MSDQGGSGKQHPSQDQALLKTRREKEMIEKSLRRKVEENEKLQKRIDQLEQQVEKLKKELVEKRQPPKWAKANKTEEQKKSAKKKGPKFGHKPAKRSKPTKIDKTVILVPEVCPNGGDDLPFPSNSKWHRHIQIDLPETRAMVTTEFKVGSSYCKKCKGYHSAKGRISNSLYGPRLHAQVCYWKYELGLTFLKIQKLLKDQYELSLSTGQISELTSKTAAAFTGTYDDLKTNLSDESHLHVVETGWRMEGVSGWLWSFSNENISVYTIEKSRGQGVVEDVLGRSGELHFHGATQLHDREPLMKPCVTVFPQLEEKQWGSPWPCSMTLSRKLQITYPTGKLRGR